MWKPIVTQHSSRNYHYLPLAFLGFFQLQLPGCPKICRHPKTVVSYKLLGFHALPAGMFSLHHRSPSSLATFMAFLSHGKKTEGSSYGQNGEGGVERRDVVLIPHTNWVEIRQGGAVCFALSLPRGCLLFSKKSGSYIWQSLEIASISERPHARLASELAVFELEAFPLFGYLSSGHQIFCNFVDTVEF